MKLVKKLLGESDVEAALQRLDRLTHDETRTTAAQTLEVVYGLVQNIRVVMDGELMHYLLCYGQLTGSLDGRSSVTGVVNELGTSRWKHKMIWSLIEHQKSHSNRQTTLTSRTVCHLPWLDDDALMLSGR